MSKKLPAFADLDLLNTLDLHTSIAHAVNDKKGGRVLSDFRNRLKDNINAALYSKPGWTRHGTGDDTVIVTDKEGKQKRVFKKAMHGSEISPKEFLENIGYTGDRFTYGHSKKR